MSKNLIITLTIAVLIILVGLGIYQKAYSPTEPEDSFTTEVASSSSPYGLGTTSDQVSTSSKPNMDNVSTSSNTTQLKNGAYLVTLKTDLGDIQFETYNADAPKTSDNFITLARKGFYDGIIFHRVIKGFMIQGGDPTGTGTGGPGYKFEDELNPNTPSYKAGYQKGVVAMANSGPNTNGSQFFIMLENVPLQKDYTIFGKVVKGQEVVDKIGEGKTGPGDRPITPVKILKATVEEK